MSVRGTIKGSSMRKVGVTLVLFSVSLVLWMLPLEVAARAWIAHFGDPLDRSMAVLRADPDLGWRQRENFSGVFEGVSLKTDDLGLRNPPRLTLSEARRQILVLGPSSAFGWGVPEEMTYARRLEQLLRSRVTDRSLHVINAGQIGFSSWQGVQFYRRELQDLRSDLVVIAYGANDVDRHRFFFDDPRPDRLALGPGLSPAAVAWQRAVGQLLFFHVARRAAASVLNRYACSDGSRSIAATWNIPSLRVSPQDYAKNLRALVQRSRENNSRVILMTTGFRLPRFLEGTVTRSEQGRVLFEEGMQLLRAQRFSDATESFSNSMLADPGQCDAYYALSFSYAALRQCADARAALQKARANEPARLKRDLQAYNQLVRELARDVDVPLVDVEQIVSRGNSEELFLDAIHFTPAGHARVAWMLLEEIAEGRLLDVTQQVVAMEGARYDQPSWSDSAP